MVVVFLVFIIKITAWWRMEDDVIEPLGAYHSIFCHPRQLVGQMTIRKAIYFLKNKFSVKCSFYLMNRQNKCAWCFHFQQWPQHRFPLFLKNEQFKIWSESVWKLRYSQWSKTCNNYSISRRWFKHSYKSVKSPFALYDSNSDQAKCKVSVLCCHSGMFQISRVRARLDRPLF